MKGAGPASKKFHYCPLSESFNKYYFFSNKKKKNRGCPICWVIWTHPHVEAHVGFPLKFTYVIHMCECRDSKPHFLL